MEQSSEVKELFSALSKAQGELHGAVRDSTNPFFGSRYANLESIWQACRSTLVKHGLSVVQTTDYHEAAGTVVITTLGHASGQWIRGRLPIKAVKNDPQGMGSAISYARRYALAAIVGVIQVDDDGEAAVEHSEQEREEQARRAAQRQAPARAPVPAQAQARQPYAPKSAPARTPVAPVRAAHREPGEDDFR